MKSLFFLALTITVAGLTSQAQCDKTLQLHSSKTNFLDAGYAVQDSKDESVVVDITKTTITITPNGNAQDALNGTIKETTCDWKVPFKEGKMVIKTDLVDGSGDVKDATITIEAKDGKTTLLAEAKEQPDRKIRIDVDKFEAKD
jgi:hypothetical protein